MSTEERPDVPDESDFGDVKEPGTSTDDGRIELEAGDSETGIFTGYDPYGGPSHATFGVLYLNGEEVIPNLRMVRQIIDQRAVGAAVRYSKGTEEKSFTRDDGEEQTYYDRNLTFAEVDG